MPESDFSSIHKKDLPPPGLLPKNTQARVIGGLALVMVLVIGFSGRKESKPKPAVQLPVSATTDPNQARIEDYKKRIQEQAEKLQAEQAQLMQTKQAMGLAPHSTPPAQQAVYRSQAPVDSRWEPAPVVREKSALEAEQEKREYQSRFASNIALSLRPETKAVASAATPDAANLLAALASTLGTKTDERAAVPSSPSKAPGAEPEHERQESKSAKTIHDSRANRDASPGAEYPLFEGTVMETVLTNRLDGSFSGPVNCMVTTNIYSQDGLHLLVPQGSRVLGEVKRVESLGQNRLAVTFHRLIMPDGFSVPLDQQQGLNQVGETGLRDRVNHHYAQVFGVSIAIGAIAGLSQANTQYGGAASAAEVYRQGVASSVSQSSLRILDRYLNVLPTFTIREGHRVKVYLSDDLLLAAYEKHPIEINPQGGLP